MTTATRAPALSPASIERATALAAKLLAGRQLGKKLPLAARAIGKALASTPPGSEHGRLLGRTLRATPGDSHRPDDEVAVLSLGCHGTTPTAAAVATEVRDMAARRARMDRLNTMAAPYAAEDGPRAAAHVAAMLADAGQGPTWAELSGAMGWPTQPWNLRASIIWHLGQAGWLKIGRKPRSLRPGPKAGGPA